MKFDYWVRHDGIDYPPNTEVPVDAHEEKSEPVTVTNDAPTYSKTEINRMSTSDLKALAKEQGLDDSKSGAELKKDLIEKFGL